MEIRDAFICHASPDKELFVRPLAEILRTHSITYWLDEAEIHWGDSVIARVGEGLQNSRYVVVLITESFCNRNFPEAELNSTLSREIAGGKTLILPVLAISKDVFMHQYPLLAAKRYVEWKDGPEVIAYELLRNLSREYKRRWTWIYPEDHKGQVWFRIAPKPGGETTKPYVCTVSWGPWRYTLRLSLSSGSVSLVHSKSHDGTPVPIILETSRDVYCDFGTDDPPMGKVIDINRGWRGVGH